MYALLALIATILTSFLTSFFPLLRLGLSAMWLPSLSSAPC